MAQSTAKTTIIDELGEQALLLPAQVNAGLRANDEAKYLFTLLQSAIAAARTGEADVNLRKERLLAGLEDERFDAVIPDARRLAGETFEVPHLPLLLTRLFKAVETMLAPVADDDGALASRLQRLSGDLRDGTSRIEGATVDAMTRARRDGEDSLHLLVMDLHKALNVLVKEIAREPVAGAHVYGLRNEDIPSVRAFMNGVNRTGPLKFDHPGLATMATRSGSDLLIQNDIGTTDAHVLVVRVRAMTAWVTYTDVHLRRARFFRDLFEGYAVSWSRLETRRPGQPMEQANYHLLTGEYAAESAGQLHDYLAHLGAQLVFLIDWNKARKRLRLFMRQGDAIGVLRWAAEHGYGHRAFIQLGGERLIYDAVNRVTRRPLRYGERLGDVLGPDALGQFFRCTLATCAEGLSARKSEQLICDEVHAELSRCFRRVEEGSAIVATEHASLIFDLASTVRDALVCMDEQRNEQARVFAAATESEADARVRQLRQHPRRGEEARLFSELVIVADDIADGLEEAASLLPLTSRLVVASKLLAPLQELGDLMVDGCKAYIRCLFALSHLTSGGREDAQDFLQAVDLAVQIEHATDQAQRNLTELLIIESSDHRQTFLLSRLADALESAGDALARACLMLRDHVLSEGVRSA